MDRSTPIAALPPDVRKGSAFPEALKRNLREAKPRAEGKASIERETATERHSLSTHQAAEPQADEP